MTVLDFAEDYIFNIAIKLRVEKRPDDSKFYYVTLHNRHGEQVLPCIDLMHARALFWELKKSIKFS